MKSFIYKFISYDGDIIYIGKTNDIKKRMKQHFGPYPHLPKECYEQVEKIFIANVNSKYNSELLETYYINKYHPKYNSDKKYKEDDNNIELNIIEPEWKELIFKKIKTKMNSNGIEFLDFNPPYLNKNLMYHECLTLAFEYNFNKLDCYKHEFYYLCPTVITSLKNPFKQLKELYLYAKQHINLNESNIDEHVGASASEQFKENYIAFNLEDIVEIAKILPDFHLLLKYGIIENLAKNIFIVHFLTSDFLREIEKAKESN